MSEEVTIPAEAQQLAASLQQPAGNEGGEKGGENTDIWGQVSKQIGVELKGPDELRAAIERGSQVEQYRNEIEKMRAELSEYQKYKPVNDFQRRLSELYSSGADEGTVQNFIRLSAGYNPSNHEETIKFAIKYRNPSYTDEDVEFAFNELVGETPDRDEFEEEEYERHMKKRLSLIRRKALEEQNFLEQQKASLKIEEQPAGAASNKIQEQSRARLQSGWSEIVNRLSPDPIQFAFEDKSIGGKYEFQWSGFDDAKEAEIKKAVIQQAVQAGLEFTPDNLEALKNTARVIRQVQYQQEFMKAMIQDAFASIQERIVKSERNIGGIRRGDSSRAQHQVKRTQQKSQAPRDML